MFCRHGNTFVTVIPELRGQKVIVSRGGKATPVKVEIGVGKGRTKGDKRQAIAARDMARDIEREVGRASKYGY